MNKGAHIPAAERDRIDEAASYWIVLLDERELTQAEQDEFDRWLAADPRHAATWRDLSRTWATLPALNDLPNLADASADVSSLPTERGWRRIRVPKMVWGAVAAIAATLAAVTWTPSLLSGPEVYQTSVAQSQLLMLDDGSQVTLGPRSRLMVAFADAERRVVLTAGEAFFEVSHDRERPFLVEAGGSITRVVGTKFDVNLARGTVRVGVLEGRVQVSRPGADPARQPVTAYLRAGEGAEISLTPANAATPGTPLIARLPAVTPGAWREGRLIYENSRLSDLVSDVNRYYAPGVTVADDRILQLRVTAAFRASEIPAFLASVGAVLPINAVETGGGTYRLEAADR